MTESTALSEALDVLGTSLGVLAHAAHEAIVLVDDQQMIVGLNPAAQRMFRCRDIELVGSPLSQLIPLPYRSVHAGHMREFESSGQIERSMTLRQPITGLRCDGQEFPARATISRIDLAVAGGMRRYFIALLSDLTQERDLLDEVAALKQRFRAILDIAPIAMWITEGERIAFINRPAVRLFGFATGEQLVGQSIYTLLHDDSHGALRAQLASTLAGDATVPKVRSGVTRPDGTQREVEIAAAALPDHGQTTMQMVIVDVTAQRAEERENERSRLDLRRLSASVVEAREDERRHIARELHDELGQRLTALKMGLSTLGPDAHRRDHDGRVAEMLEMIDETVAAVRRIAADLRPLMLDDLGLNAAIEWLARDAARRLDMEVTVRLGPDDPPLDDRATIAVYRMVQEALTNVARHARATVARVEMRQQAGELVLSVQDNGIGFADHSLRRDGKYGLMGIRERAYMLGGRLDIDNPPGGGGCLTVHLPLRRGDAQAAVSEIGSPR